MSAGLVCTLLAAGGLRAGLGLLPLLVLAGAVLLVAAYREAGPGRLRESLLIAVVAAGMWVVIGSEVLSLGGGIWFWPVFLWWAVPGAVVWWMWWRRRARTKGLLALPRGCPWSVWPPVVITAGLLLLAGVVAARSPPLFVDSLIYHMPRQVYWVQEQSVGHYLTRNPLQLAMPPMAEYVGLHLMVLSAGDWYSTLVQWVALVMCAAGVSLLVRELGAPPLAQAMGALLMVSSPMAWLQAASVKNDIIVALWVLVVACWAVKVIRDGACGPGRWVILGCATGLAVLTKFSGAVFALPILVALGLWLLVHRRAACVPLAGTVLVITLALSTPHMARNMAVFGSPHGAAYMTWGEGHSYANQTWAPGAVASVMIRNIGQHAGLPWRRVNIRTEAAIRRMHDWIGQPFNDPRTTTHWGFRVTYQPWSEADAGSPLHVALAGAALIGLPVLVFAGRRGKARSGIGRAEGVRIAVVMAAALAAFALFSMLFRWQPWGTRLHVGLFALLAGVTAAVLCRGGGRGIGALGLCALLLAQILATLKSPEALRPLTGPRSIFTNQRHELVPRYDEWRGHVEEVAKFIAQIEPEYIGVSLWHDYIVQYRVLRELPRRPRFTDPLAAPEGTMFWIGVHPEPKPSPARFDPWPRPDVAVLEASHWRERFVDRSSGAMMYEIATFGRYSIFVPEDVARRLHGRGIIETLPAFAADEGPDTLAELISVLRARLEVEAHDLTPSRRWLRLTYDNKRDFHYSLRPYPVVRLGMLEREPARHDQEVSGSWPADHHVAASSQWDRDHHQDASSAWPPNHEITPSEFQDRR